MTTGYICNRCGAAFESGGKWLYSGYSGSHAVMQWWDLCPGCTEGFTGWMERGQESQDVTGDAERVTESPELLHDTREKLEEDVLAATRKTGTANQEYVWRWLDRQAAITGREFFETACQGCERLGGGRRELMTNTQPDRLQLRQQVDELKAALAALTRERDGWRAAYGALLDGIHEAQRKAREGEPR